VRITPAERREVHYCLTGSSGDKISRIECRVQSRQEALAYDEDRERGGGVVWEFFLSRCEVLGQGCLCVQIVKHSETN